MFKFASRIVMSLSALALVAATAFAAPAATAFADEGTPPAPQEVQHVPNARLERMYAREQQWLGAQAERLAHTGEVVGRVQALIARLEERGHDPQPVADALAAFEGSVAEARAAHDAAAAVLAAHAGFDDDGQVTDRELAGQTVRDAGQSLREAHRLLREAGHSLRQAIRDYLRSIRPNDKIEQPAPAQP